MDHDAQHIAYMRTALLQARQAARLQEVPVGAVLVSAEGDILAKAHNRTICNHDPSAHAEMLAIRQAAGANASNVSAAEAALTAELMGNRVVRIHDVGVAGIHRLLSRRRRLEEAAVIIVVAGMEGALPSVVGGLVDRPVIAVPTSVGYGAAFGGLAALLAMLNSCANGVAVVNIDNGFGAGYLAALVNRRD